MKLSIKKGSENYAAQVIALPSKSPVPGLDNLVQVTHLGNNCLVQKSSDQNVKYLFFPAGTVLDPRYLANNNLYRHSHNNLDTSRSGFFDDSGRVKAIRFKGVISTGFIIPVKSLSFLTDPALLNIGDTFTNIDNKPVCWKYLRKQRGFSAGTKSPKFEIETLLDPRFAPEHTDTGQLLKPGNTDRFTLDTPVTITHKLHGTSIRIFNTRTKRKLNFIERCLKAIGVKVVDHQYSYIVASRRVIKSKDFKCLHNPKNFKDDLWSKVARNNLEGKLCQGEAVYGEIIGMDYAGGAIQLDYTYGFPGPKLYIYRITQINPEGVEVDLSWEQVKQRAKQLGVDTVPELYSGKLRHILEAHKITVNQTKEDPDILPALETLFHEKLLDKPSLLDRFVVEEGYVVRQEMYPKVTAYKIKSRKFLVHESKLQDKEVVDMEEDN